MKESIQTVLKVHSLIFSTKKISHQVNRVMSSGTIFTPKKFHSIHTIEKLMSLRLWQIILVKFLKCPKLALKWPKTVLLSYCLLLLQNKVAYNLYRLKKNLVIVLVNIFWTCKIVLMNFDNLYYLKIIEMERKWLNSNLKFKKFICIFLM